MFPYQRVTQLYSSTIIWPRISIVQSTKKKKKKRGGNREPTKMGNIGSRRMRRRHQQGKDENNYVETRRHYRHPGSSPPPPPYVYRAKTVTVKNDAINIRKESLCVEPDVTNPHRFFLTFILDATAPGWYVMPPPTSFLQPNFSFFTYPTFKSCAAKSSMFSSFFPCHVR